MPWGRPMLMFVRSTQAGSGEKATGTEPWGAVGSPCGCPGPSCTFLPRPALLLAGLGKESELKAALFWPFIFTELNSSSWLERQTKSPVRHFLQQPGTASTSSPQGRCFGVPPTASCSHGNPSVFTAESKAHSRCVGFAAAKDFYDCFSHTCCAIS